PRVAVEREASAEIRIAARSLSKEFPRGRRLSPLRAVDGVSFDVASGTTHAIVGESGSGKTTVARMVMGLVAPTSGDAIVAGRNAQSGGQRERTEFRSNVQLVYQNPFSSLEPRQRIGSIIAEPLRNFEQLDRLEIRGRV